MHASPFKRWPTLADWMVFVAAYAIDFSWIVSGYWGLSLLAYWIGFVITMAMIVMYVPRGWDFLLIVVLIVVSFSAIVLLGSESPAHPPSAATHRR